MATQTHDDMPVTSLRANMHTLVLGVTVGVSAACGTVEKMYQGVDRMSVVSASVEKSLGAKPRVGFQYQDGALATVSVTFDTLPAGRSLEEIIRTSADAVKAGFKESPRSLVVGFEVRP